MRRGKMQGDEDGVEAPLDMTDEEYKEAFSMEEVLEDAMQICLMTKPSDPYKLMASFFVNLSVKFEEMEEKASQSRHFLSSLASIVEE